MITTLCVFVSLCLFIWALFVWALGHKLNKEEFASIIDSIQTEDTQVFLGLDGQWLMCECSFALKSNVAQILIGSPSFTAIIYTNGKRAYFRAKKMPDYLLMGVFYKSILENYKNVSEV